MSSSNLKYQPIKMLIPSSQPRFYLLLYTVKNLIFKSVCILFVITNIKIFPPFILSTIISINQFLLFLKYIVFICDFHLLLSRICCLYISVLYLYINFIISSISPVTNMTSFIYNNNKVN